MATHTRTPIGDHGTGSSAAVHRPVNHALVRQLDQAYRQMLALVQELPEQQWRLQYHPDLSPIGWHIGHSIFIETYWVREVVGSDASITESLKDLYLPWLSPKAERGNKLQHKTRLIEFSQQLHRDNLDLLQQWLQQGHKHALLENDYLLYFLSQHYYQHTETLQQILWLRALPTKPSTYQCQQPLQAASTQTSWLRFNATHSRIGSDGRDGRDGAYDNELPQHEIKLDAFELAAQPVNNAEYLAFMHAGAYSHADYWDPAGWEWCQTNAIKAPLYWRQDAEHHWYQRTTQGNQDIDPQAAVTGISYYEAQAYARYCGCRLPRENEWEHAMSVNASLRASSGEVWEWCANTFYPYPGFYAFPYDAYSIPSFDQGHYTLRGGSEYTATQLKRLSFRNFYEPEKRHIFAGLRLAK